MFKFGYVAVIGNTNVGKSTLINSLVGEKIAIVSPQKQTTRENILGVLTENETQIVFVDTPGIHRTNNHLDKYMMKNVRSAVSSVDIVFYIIDPSQKFTDVEIEYIKNLKDAMVFIGISKIDKYKFDKVYPIIEKLKAIPEIKDIIPFSAHNGTNIELIKESIVKNLPEYQEKCFMFSDEEKTDQDENHRIAEVIREKALLTLNDELPHGVAVCITRNDIKKSTKFIDVDIVCEKETHKNIIIGKGGSKTKEIGSLAREDLEEMFGQQVMLKIYVRVIENWRQKPNVLKEIGYKTDI